MRRMRSSGKAAAFAKARVKEKAPPDSEKGLRGVIAELRKVVWPSRRDVLYLTLLVITITLAAGIVLGFIDLGFAEFIKKAVIR